MKIDLRGPDLRNLEPGTCVISSKGFEFEFLGRDVRNKEIWLDKTSGLKWFDEEKGKFNHYEAMEKFNSTKQRLPTKKEFKEAEKHGFREVLAINSKWFWSASVHPNYSYNAYVFYGSNGDIYNFNRDYYYYAVGSVRCVAR